MKIITIYILKKFTSSLFFSLVALCIIFVIVNLLENLDDFLDQNATIDVIIKYYLYFLPEIIKLTIPISVLLSALFSVGNLSVNNEITALKASGISLYQILMPFLLVSVLISFIHLYFNGWIVPKVNQKKIVIENQYMNKISSGGPLYNLYFRDSPTKNVIMAYYIPEEKYGTNITIELFNNQIHPRIVKRYESEKLIWDSSQGNWKLVNGLIRDFEDNKITFQKFDTILAEISFTHEQIVNIRKTTDEMTFDELEGYINLLEKGGRDVRKQRIDLYGAYAFPFANVIVIIFAVPFSSIRRKSGIAIQIAAAMIVAFFYLLFTKLGQSIGYAYNLSPIVSAWLANIVFFIVGLFNLLKTRS